MQFDQPKRRQFIMLLGGAAALPVAAFAQQVQKSYRLAYLALAGDQDAVIVRYRLAELGYAEGKNLIFDFAPPKHTRSACPNWRPTWSKPIRT
jgi:hypothetical protein